MRKTIDDDIGRKIEMSCQNKNLTVIRLPSDGFPAISLRAYSAISDASTAYTCLAPA